MAVPRSSYILSNTFEGLDSVTGKKSVSFSWQVTLDFFNEFIPNGVFLQPVNATVAEYCPGGYGVVPSSNVADTSMVPGIRLRLSLWDCDKCDRHQSLVMTWSKSHDSAGKAYEAVETWSGQSR